MKTIPKKLLQTKFRREMWKHAKKIVEQVGSTIPIKHAYLMGSFSTKKDKPSDIDFIILLQTPEKEKLSEWSVDLVIAPDNPFGQEVLRDTDEWMKNRYGQKKTTIIKLK